MHDFQYSTAFSDSLDVQVKDVAVELLKVFNAALNGVAEEDGKLAVSFKYWDKDGVSETLYTHIFPLVYTLRNGVLELPDVDYSSRRIIKICDQSAAERDGLVSDIRLSVEKYALADFLMQVARDYFSVEIPVEDKCKLTIACSEHDAAVCLDGEPQSTVNGVCSVLVNPGTVLEVNITKKGFRSVLENVRVDMDTVKKFTLEREMKILHLAVTPADAEVKMYAKADSLFSAKKDSSTALTDTISVNSMLGILSETPDNEVELERQGGMYVARLPQGSKYVLEVKKRLFGTQTKEISMDDNVYEVISLEKKSVRVDLSTDEAFKSAYVSLNGKSIELPYSFDMAVGESAMVLASWDGHEYRNYILANEADVANGLQYKINFIREYTCDLQVLNPGATLTVNGQVQAVPYFSSSFTEQSRVDVRIEKSGYVPITETFYMTKDVQKQYTLTELVPAHTFKCSVVPEDAILTINGKAVSNPYENDFYEGSEVTIRAVKQNYVAFGEKVVINEPTTKEIVLEKIEIAHPKVSISCNVPSAVAKVNDQDVDLPINLTVDQGTRLKLEISAEGYHTWNEVIKVYDQDITREIELQEMTPEEMADTVDVVFNVNRINSIVMLNNKQIDGTIESDDEGNIFNYRFATEVPRNTVCHVLVTNPGYAPYRTQFVADDDKETNVILQKAENIEFFRLNVFVKTEGAILKVDDSPVSYPFTKDYKANADVKIECYKDGKEPFIDNVVMNTNQVVQIELSDVPEPDPEEPELLFD